MLCLPPMLILDEATSSIDTRTEVRIQKPLPHDAGAYQLYRGAPPFHHPGGRCHPCDEGRPHRGAGNHDQLLAQGGFYAKLYNSQFEGVQT